MSSTNSKTQARDVPRRVRDFPAEKSLSPRASRAAEPLLATSRAFVRTVWAFYKQHGRHDLPWRPPTLKLRKGKEDELAYRVLVSEVMLQQTQVERVITYYEKFIKLFPTARKLAAAPLGEVLAAWQGLGYNRRAKQLQEAAKAVGQSVFPKHVERLEDLPGVGPYTARAIAAFAYNQDVVFIETNIRTAIIHDFFMRSASTSSPRSAQAVRRPREVPAEGPMQHLGKNVPASRKISDREITEVLRAVLPKGRSREWYYALMDYGAHLKRSGIRLNAKSKHYAKQSKFAGSSRQARGAILKELAKGSATEARLLGILGDDRVPQLKTALAALLTEHLIQKRGNRFQLPR